MARKKKGEGNHKLAVAFDSDRQHTFLTTFADTGRVMQSAAEAGICDQTVRELAKRDKDFAIAYEAARQFYCEKIEKEIHRRAIDGWEDWKTVAGVAQKVTRFSDRLLELLAKRHIPEYRDSQVDINVNQGGVLVVGAPAKDTREWTDRYGNAQSPDPIDITPAKEEKKKVKRS